MKFSGSSGHTGAEGRGDMRLVILTALSDSFTGRKPTIKLENRT